MPGEPRDEELYDLGTSDAVYLSIVTTRLHANDPPLGEFLVVRSSSNCPRLVLRGYQLTQKIYMYVCFRSHAPQK